MPAAATAIQLRNRLLPAATVFGVIGLAMVYLGGRVAYLQTNDKNDQRKKLELQQYRTEVLQARRGCIFDRNGLLLAGNERRYNVFIDPKFMMGEFANLKIKPTDGSDPEVARKRLWQEAVQKICTTVGITEAEFAGSVKDWSTQKYVRIAIEKPEEVALAVSKLRMTVPGWKQDQPIPGVGTTAVTIRTYPMGTMAAQLLGGVSADGGGLEGLELQFDSLLAGRNGFCREQTTKERRGFDVADDDLQLPVHGQHLVLTIDANIQTIAEKELTEACVENQVDRGECVVLDPKTGEVLAMAHWPTYDPADVRNIRTPKGKVNPVKNRALYDAYEPGSTIKPFIVSPALADGVTTISEMWHTQTPYITATGRRITDHGSGYPTLSTWDVLVKSSNVGMVHLAERLGSTRLRDELTRWEFGQKTGIELRGESRGRLKPLTSIGKKDVESMGMGYALMVTPVQLVRGIAAIANGGILPPVEIIKGEVAADGSIKDLNLPHKEPRRVLDAATAADVRRILADVPIRGTAKAVSPRPVTWTVFGKTGTAHVVSGSRYTDKYTASFIGGAPLEDPRLVIAVVLHEVPKLSKDAYFGGKASAPAAIAILERSLNLMQVPASPPIPLPPDSVKLWNYKPDEYKLFREKTAVVDDLGPVPTTLPPELADDEIDPAGTQTADIPAIQPQPLTPGLIPAMALSEEGAPAAPVAPRGKASKPIHPKSQTR